MQKDLFTHAVAGAAAGMLLGVFYWPQNQAAAQGDDYNPVIDPANFVPQIDNKYFTLKPGTKFMYKSSTLRGPERIEVEVTPETKKVMGVTSVVVRDRVWLNNKLIEDTKDWYAQDKEGNVWYFGEMVYNYKDGQLKDHAGSWEAGVGGAKPGIIMQSRPKVGETYRQEYYKGKAEDMGTVVAVGKKVTVGNKSYDDCVQIRDWSKIERLANEYKYYCPEIGFKVLEESAWLGSFLFGYGVTELVGVSSK